MICQLCNHFSPTTEPNGKCKKHVVTHGDLYVTENFGCLLFEQKIEIKPVQQVTGLRLLIKYPSRERMSQFFTVLNKAQRMRGLPNTRFLVTLDTDDKVMNSDRCKKVLDMWGNLTYIYGQSENKVHAINRDMDKAGEWDILLLLSDDMHPARQNYDKIICERFEKHFPDLDGVLWMNDGHAGNKLNTIVCIGKKYYERFKYLYNPIYTSLFCDNEFTEVSQRLQKFVYLDQILIEHRHPMNVRDVAMDGLYSRNDSFHAQDKRTFNNRRAVNFVP